MKRFWNKVHKTKTCWLWKYPSKDGYGRYSTERKYAHRFSWELIYGKIPKGFVICHKCDIKNCVNPKHLFLGRQSDNIKDKVKKDRQAKGNDIPTSKLTEKEVLEIRNKYIPRIYSIRMLAREYNVAYDSIWSIVNKQSWKHI